MEREAERYMERFDIRNYARMEELAKQVQNLEGESGRKDGGKLKLPWTGGAVPCWMDSAATG